MDCVELRVGKCVFVVVGDFPASEIVPWRSISSSLAKSRTQFSDTGRGNPDMNLAYAYDVMTAANEQPQSLIKLHGLQASHELRLMTEAGLVEATFDDGAKGSFLSIKRVTATGKTFLRAFKDHPIPTEATLAESTQEILAANWKTDSDPVLLPFREAA
jgi:hypothetical protein